MAATHPSIGCFQASRSTSLDRLRYGRLTVLYDAHGRKVYEGGLLREDIRDAIQAAARADDFKLAYEIAERYGWNNICLNCATAFKTTEFVDRYGHWPVCAPCKEVLAPEPNFSDVKTYLHGLIKRNVV